MLNNPIATGIHPAPSEPNNDSTTDVTDTKDTEEEREMRTNQALASIPMDPSVPVNLKEIAHKHSVSYNTFWRRHLGETKPRKVSSTNQQKLTPAQEQKIVDWAIFLSIQGQPVDRDTLAPKLLDLHPDWVNGPSKHWWKLFFGRHPEVKLQKASGVPPKRAQAFNFTAVNELFQLVDYVIVRTTSAEGSSSEGLRRDAQNTSQATTRE